MDSRMRKYDENSNVMSRTKRNADVYTTLDMNDLSRIRTNNNVSVISEAPKQIDVEKIKRYIYTKNDEEHERKSRVTLDLPEEETLKVEKTEPKDYDINSVLERARESKETNYENTRYRKLNNTEYDILNKIKVETEEHEEDPDITGPISELNTEEKTIVDLINDISKTKISKKEELFSDLMSDNDNTVILPPINNEINVPDLKEELDNITIDLDNIGKPLSDLTRDLMLEKEKHKITDDIKDDVPPSVEKIDIPLGDTSKMSNIDKSFFTNSLSFSKGDFEGTDVEFEEKPKSDFYTKFAIAFVIIILIATAIIVLNFVLDLNWF